jgi:hypothetical protein
MSDDSSSKKTASTQPGFEWAGAVARVRRGGQSGRSARRAALLGALTAAYANTSRNGRGADRPTVVR